MFMLNAELISVKDLKIGCYNFDTFRKDYFITNNIKELFEKFPLKKILGFLEEAGFYNLI